MQQAQDFLSEAETLSEVLEDLPDADWHRPTQFKGWTINDVISHLNFWNHAADLSWRDPEAFQHFTKDIPAAMRAGSMRPVEASAFPQAGRDLFLIWRDLYRDMGRRWSAIDPKTRVAWMGPDMSARSMMTARQMEIWAHGQEIFDVLGLDQPQRDSIRNIVVLGVNTFGWSHRVRGIAVPDRIPSLHLRSPSGDLWVFGNEGEGELIEGPAVEFAQVVTQTRNVADTQLSVSGPIATQWMQTAQCFAGPPETPPPPGARFRASGHSAAQPRTELKAQSPDGPRPA